MTNLRVNSLRFEAVGAPDPGLRVLPNFQVENLPPDTGLLSALDVVAVVSLGGITFPLRWDDPIRVGENLRQWGPRELKMFVPLGREAIDRIEAARQHNVTLDFSAILRYFPEPGPPAAAYSYGQTRLLIPENEWLEALDEMGYQGGWVIEIERPFIEGWPRAIEFLDKASDRILSHDPEGAIAQCRAAWESLSPLLDAAWDGIAAEVDRGSAPEEGYPLKSERVRAFWESALKWTHTGAHPESYAASMDDALLAYRVTVSLMSFLSRKTVQSEARKLTKNGGV